MAVARDPRPWGFNRPTKRRLKPTAGRPFTSDPCPVRGEQHGQARLTEAQVIELRRRYAAGGVTQRTLAAELGVTPRAVALIIRGQRWGHIASPSLACPLPGR